MNTCVLCKKEIVEGALFRAVKAMGYASLCVVCNELHGEKIDEFFGAQLKKATEFVQGLISLKDAA